MNRLDFEYDNGYYTEKKTYDKYLSIMAGIFDDGYSWTEAVKDHLLQQNSPGITGNMVDIIIEDNLVIIEPLYAQNITESTIHIDRQALLDLINQWQKLVAKQCQLITFTRHEDGTITLSGE